MEENLARKLLPKNVKDDSQLILYQIPTTVKGGEQGASIKQVLVVVVAPFLISARLVVLLHLLQPLVGLSSHFCDGFGFGSELDCSLSTAGALAETTVVIPSQQHPTRLVIA